MGDEATAGAAGGVLRAVLLPASCSKQLRSPHSFSSCHPLLPCCAGVEDVHAELAAYMAVMAASATRVEAVAAARQRRTRAADVPGLAPLDSLDDLESLPQRIAILNELREQVFGASGGWKGRLC